MSHSRSGKILASTNVTQVGTARGLTKLAGAMQSICNVPKNAVVEPEKKGKRKTASRVQREGKPRLSDKDWKEILQPALLD